MFIVSAYIFNPKGNCSKQFMAFQSYKWPYFIPFGNILEFLYELATSLRWSHSFGKECFFVFSESYLYQL